MLSDLGQTIFDKLAENEIRFNKTIPATTREAVISARVGQGIYRDNLEQIESCCRVTGVSDRRFLIASHIKPWRLSTNDERLDGNNGLLLSPHIDRLFDGGYITFSDRGEMFVASRDITDSLIKFGISDCLIKRPFSKEQNAYLEYHRTNSYKGHEFK